LKKQKRMQDLPPKLRYLLQKAMDAKREKRSVPVGDYQSNEIIQLGEAAVAGRLPPEATRDDMRAALGRCGMRVNDILYELEQRAEPDLSDEVQAAIIVELLFEAFDSALMDVIVHKL
jgi:hypothetical protein